MIAGRSHLFSPHPVVDGKPYWDGGLYSNTPSTWCSTTIRNIQTYEALHNLRRVVRELYGELSEAKRKDPKMRELAEYGCHTTMDIVHLGNRDRVWELATKDLDFSRTAIDERWQLGYADATQMLEGAGWMDPVDPLVGVVVHRMPTVAA
ncbi:MAG TPA: DUF3734 domain-containing protein [Casimicrobiaceae bacterium]|nr:DUF3734 domain-containing protein [Casimicrobiaceae bacterium]